MGSPFLGNFAIWFLSVEDTIVFFFSHKRRRERRGSRDGSISGAAAPSSGSRFRIASTPFIPLHEEGSRNEDDCDPGSHAEITRVPGEPERAGLPHKGILRGPVSNAAEAVGMVLRGRHVAQPAAEASQGTVSLHRRAGSSS